LRTASPFTSACTGISDLAAKALKSPERADQVETLKTLSSFLDRGAMSLVVTADGREIYRYGEARDTRSSRPRRWRWGGEGTVSSGKRQPAHPSRRMPTASTMRSFYTEPQRELSYSNLKTAVILAGSVLLLAILLSVIFHRPLPDALRRAPCGAAAGASVDGVRADQRGKSGLSAGIYGKGRVSACVPRISTTWPGG
jgi:hypothetical protein